LKTSPDIELLLADNIVFLYRLVCQCQVEKLVLTIQPASLITSTSLENFDGEQTWINKNSCIQQYVLTNWFPKQLLAFDVDLVLYQIFLSIYELLLTIIYWYVEENKMFSFTKCKEFLNKYPLKLAELYALFLFMLYSLDQ
jgi:hypothetical protein